MPIKLPTTTPTPDEIFDVWMADLSHPELKVLLYIVRRTLGFKKDADRISIDQMCNGIVKHNGERLDKGTGLKRTAVTDALRSLKERGLIESTTQFSDDGTSRPSLYTLLFEGPPARTLGSAATAGEGPRERVRQSGPTTNRETTNSSTSNPLPPKGGKRLTRQERKERAESPDKFFDPTAKYAMCRTHNTLKSQCECPSAP
jgi:phage replication O-like protein O